ncbi:MAG: SH3 domain-containing protein [Gammaproteobacteria bacterium]|nr:SH3 domain-containing protein [Gammaproteobacteria bacterium]
MKFMSALLIVLLPLVGTADVVAPVERVKNSVNIRLGPDASSDVVGRLKRGESLPLVNAGEDWHEVQLEGDTTGFINADWVVVYVDDTALEVVEEVVDAVEAGVEEVVDEEAEVVAEEIAVETSEEVIEEAVELEIAEDAAEVAEAIGVAGPPGPAGPAGAATIKGSENFLVKFKKETEGGNSQIYDDGNQIGIGTTDPKQRLEVNGSIQIHEQNSSVAGLMITQSSGETGYIMHNRASTLTIGAGSQDRITIDRDGNVGIGVSKPNHPLEMASGAHVTAGGAWTNSSSREKKENIAELPAAEAKAALMQLEPVLFNYRNERAEDYVGFIAEEVPDLVATSDRQSLSTMDIVAVLTKVVQEQQQRIEALEARLK